MSNKSQVHIVGAGFSGLTLAYELSKKNIDVVVYEKEDHVGGLIQTHRHQDMLVETAANALIWTESIDQLFKDLNLKYVKLKQESKQRFFFHQGKVCRWPLSLLATLAFVLRLFKMIFTGFRFVKPLPGETIFAWGVKHLGLFFTRDVLSVGLQGVYAGDSREMSASLVLGRFFEPKKNPRKKYNGSIAPAQGMGQLMETLKQYLQNQNVKFERKNVTDFSEFNGPVVLAVSLKDLSVFKSEFDFKSENLQMLPLARATVAYKSPKEKIHGFGVLINENSNLKTLGVLSNTMIFDGRGPCYNESWIIGGARTLDVMDLKNSDLLGLIQSERQILLGATDPMHSSEVVRWPKALPHYNLELEKWLDSIKDKKIVSSQKQRIYLTGNYLGRLGLSQIYEMNKSLAEEIKNDFLQSSNS